ncbi:heterokaryon incompatibility protein-domain-containing protein [Xylaria arbuscula]|nr:heterokaryon incompatibility protein-domain-containing protein [Xylaria arbuscula]
MTSVNDQTKASPHSLIYSPLDHTRSEVRFIKIIPSTDSTDDQQVSCRLETAELSEDTHYAALSYVWGDSSVTECVVVNGTELPVTTNLASALRHFSKHGLPNIQEKNHQVPIIEKLYINAKLVLSWLGAPDSSQLDKALRIISDFTSVIGVTPNRHDLEPNTELSTEMTHTGFKWLYSTLGPLVDPTTHKFTIKWAPLSALTKSTYWGRVWIVQEIVLAKPLRTHLFLCGDASATFAELTLFTSFLNSIKTTPLPTFDRDGAQSMERLTWIILSREPVCKIPGMGMIRILKLHRKDPGEVNPDSVFGFACTVAVHCSATLPHDYIYGVLEMVPENHIQPDYGKSVKEVYLEAAVGRVSSLYLGMSGRGFGAKNEHNLPSWLPDLTQLRLPFKVTFFDMRDRKEPLLEVETVPSSQKVSKDTLRVQGAICGRVEIVQHLAFDLDAPEEKTLYRICVDYLIELFGVLQAVAVVKGFKMPWSSRDIAGRIAGRRPLEALFDVLDWRKRDSRSKSSKHLRLSGLNLSPAAWRFLIMLRTSTALTPDERRDALKRLGCPPGVNLRVFMAHCFADNRSVSLDDEDIDNWPMDTAKLELEELLQYTNNQSLFKTDNGYLGIGPPNIKPGDLVCATSAASLPILLRKVIESDGRGGSHLEHEGCCYVLGLSDDEPATMVANGQLEVQTLDIR